MPLQCLKIHPHSTNRARPDDTHAISVLLDKDLGMGDYFASPTKRIAIVSPSFTRAMRNDPRNYQKYTARQFRCLTEVIPYKCQLPELAF